MIARGIREFMARDWAAARLAKDDYWSSRIAQLGPAEGMRVAEDLRRHMRKLHPAWPTSADRDKDFQAHLRLSGLLRRAESVRRR